MVSACIEAAKLLEGEGISARVINMSTLKPLDKQAVISAARDTGAIVTAEEHSVIGGLGGAVSETLSCQCPTPLRIVGVNDRFGVSGKPDELLERYGLTAENIKDNALEAINMKNKPASGNGKGIS